MTKDRTINPRILGNLPQVLLSFPTSPTQFTLETEFIDNWDLLNYDISAYPGLILKLRFVRMLTYYNLQLFIPSGLFVLLAWATMVTPLTSRSFQFFPSTTPGIRAQYNVQITNLINMLVTPPPHPPPQLHAQQRDPDDCAEDELHDLRPVLDTGLLR